jgi:cytoskeletal protein RodZ
MFEIGNTLREARLRRGLDILDCEAETKIRAKYLRAMEEEQFDLMPSPTYVRGFLRTYSEFLDLDGQLVLDEYESRFGTFDAPFDAGARTVRGPRPSRHQAHQGHHQDDERRRPGARARRGRPPRRRRTELQLLWLAIGGVMAVALLVWLGVGESDSPSPLPESPAVSTGAAVAPAAPVAEPDTAAQEGPVRVKKTPIVLTGTGTIGSWVEVRSRNADGRKVFEAILEPGEAQSFRVLEGIWIRAANPAELQVTVAGKEVELGSSATGNWIITPQGAKSVG